MFLSFSRSDFPKNGLRPCWKNNRARGSIEPIVTMMLEPRHRARPVTLFAS
jgi:hypothetical protein